MCAGQEVDAYWVAETVVHGGLCPSRSQSAPHAVAAQGARVHQLRLYSSFLILIPCSSPTPLPVTVCAAGWMSTQGVKGCLRVQQATWVMVPTSRPLASGYRIQIAPCTPPIVSAFLAEAPDCRGHGDNFSVSTAASTACHSPYNPLASNSYSGILVKPGLVLRAIIPRDDCAQALHLPKQHVDLPLLRCCRSRGVSDGVDAMNAEVVGKRKCMPVRSGRIPRIPSEVNVRCDGRCDGCEAADHATCYCAAVHRDPGGARGDGEGYARGRGVGQTRRGRGEYIQNTDITYIFKPECTVYRPSIGTAAAADATCQISCLPPTTMITTANAQVPWLRIPRTDSREDAWHRSQASLGNPKPALLPKRRRFRAFHSNPDGYPPCAPSSAFVPVRLACPRMHAPLSRTSSANRFLADRTAAHVVEKRCLDVVIYRRGLCATVRFSVQKIFEFCERVRTSDATILLYFKNEPKRHFLLKNQDESWLKLTSYILVEVSLARGSENQDKVLCSRVLMGSKNDRDGRPMDRLWGFFRLMGSGKRLWKKIRVVSRRGKKKQVRTRSNLNWTANVGPVQRSGSWLNRTEGPVQRSENLALNWTEPDRGNTSLLPFFRLLQFAPHQSSTPVNSGLILYSQHLQCLNVSLKLQIHSHRMFSKQFRSETHSRFQSFKLLKHCLVSRDGVLWRLGVAVLPGGALATPASRSSALAGINNFLRASSGLSIPVVHKFDSMPLVIERGGAYGSIALSGPITSYIATGHFPDDHSQGRELRATPFRAAVVANSRICARVEEELQSIALKFRVARGREVFPLHIFRMRIHVFRGEHACASPMRPRKHALKLCGHGCTQRACSGHGVPTRAAQ
ncbi:hypothetical protein C8R47DRAFT_1262463 [Mycena vitilis]|nr:hypothetical protein C8R47DRAFT_1262463 [Mycena vitilis]